MCPTYKNAIRFTPGKDDPSKANEEIRAAVSELQSKYNKYTASTSPDKSDVWDKGVIGDWDVSNVTDMSKLFLDFYKFNEPLNDWNVSNVNNMSYMFGGCFVTYTDTTDKGMFGNIAANFKQSLTNLNNIRVRDVSYCMSFNQPLDKWDVSKATDMSSMFSGCTYFDQNISNWDVRNVTDMNRMFVDCSKFNQPFDNWKVNPTTNLNYMFSDCSNFNQPAIS